MLYTFKNKDSQKALYGSIKTLLHMHNFFVFSGDRFDGDCKVPMTDQHEHDHTSALTDYSKLLQDTGNSRWHGHRRTTRLMLPKTAPLTQDKMQVHRSFCNIKLRDWLEGATLPPVSNLMEIKYCVLISSEMKICFSCVITHVTCLVFSCIQRNPQLVQINQRVSF